ncbi:MAG: thioredoxin family protein [Proteobacteria bacterium]|nr:thioredoxin family protein [Pseudomonadota bacterium]
MITLGGACAPEQTAAPTVTRRASLLAAALLLLIALDANAAERRPYEPAVFERALEAGQPILVHVTAPWCVECELQRPIVAALAEQPEYKDLTIFDVDFDTQKGALRRFKVRMQSTLVIFRDKAEVARATGITRREAIEAVMKQAL